MGLNDPSVAVYGGPHSTFEFPLTDPTAQIISRNRNLISSYGENCWNYNPKPTVFEIQGRPTSLNWRKIERATQPTETPLFGDTMWRGAGPQHTDALPTSNGEWAGADSESRHFAIMRHGKGSQLLFYDGSARHLRTRILWRLRWNKAFDVNYAANRGQNFSLRGCRERIGRRVVAQSENLTIAKVPSRAKVLHLVPSLMTSISLLRTPTYDRENSESAIARSLEA